jgi:hypothetical protein
MPVHRPLLCAKAIAVHHMAGYLASSIWFTWQIANYKKNKEL